MATPYFPPPPGQESQFPPPQRAATFQSHPHRVSDVSAPDFDFPAPQRQQTAPTVTPPPTDINSAAFAANGYNTSPFGPTPVQPPQPSPPPSLPAAVQSQSAQILPATNQDDVGTFNGGSYRISHRDSNSILTMQLAMGCPIEAKPGVMVAMSGKISLRGSMKWSMMKMLAGSMTFSTYTGPGEILLAPPTLGDIIVLRLNGTETWKVGKDGFLAATSGVVKDYKAQGLTKAVFSGEGFIIYHMSGTGLLWLQSFGAIIRKDIPEGESYLVDNGYLVAWNCKYTMTRAAGGGMFSTYSSAEGLACKFDGPGTVYLQTRNAAAFAAHLSTK
ncbi:tryptophan RNA-binding attenuator protein-like domain-containing protein [Aspergillus pseudonomiae]|uniref:Altered inheritance of mitochondria protein 24, mitochondrial n=1 Tax=Aspergillus pseudonomiae TaxID=1506151 RepID=A0A5N7DLD1_9EURO|nr:tryptophan RNA-binding attenuator protein-like domain-containing protein [Aspergillus pseudonomiae]KAB8260259.1 tryptophan RNA-binding attenuator protein-like domain-containing protein [Aspergillus pseudonomiae]KAE8407257.1 tryptophan RNA-binding attenuator protein-like domain-containing protein [Aspergillus pseudonomiae]